MNKDNSNNIERKIKDSDIRINKTDDESWDVEVLIPFEDAHDDSLPEILQLVKSKIGKDSSIPVGLLKYRRLKKKSVEADGIKMVAKIVKSVPESGDPVLRFLNGRSSYGVEYDDMSLYLDLYPMKESGEKTRLRDVRDPLEKLNLKAVDEAMEIIDKDLTPVKNILIGQGRFPHPSFDAQVNFNFDLKDFRVNHYVSAGKVLKGDVLCKKTSAIKGAISGYTVRGKEILPPNPKDIELVSGENCTMKKDSSEIISSLDGIVHVKESNSWDSDILSRVSVSISPIQVIDSKEKLDITTSENLEINGDIKSGSKIISRGDVLVNGDIEKDTSIISSGNINVDGNIDGASLISGGDIDDFGNITGSELVAKGGVTVSGTVSDSEISGYEVHINRVVGCKVKAGSLIVIDTVSDDESGFATELNTGLAEQFAEIISHNDKIIDYLMQRLNRCRKVVGKEIVDTATPGNAPRLYLKLLQELKRNGEYDYSPGQNEALKELITAIGPLRDLLEEKIDQNALYKNEISRRSSEKSKIVVTTGVQKGVKVEMDGLTSKIEPEDKSVVLGESGGSILKKSIESKKDKYPDIE